MLNGIIIYIASFIEIGIIIIKFSQKGDSMNKTTKGIRFRARIMLLVLGPMLFISILIGLIGINAVAQMGQERMRSELYTYGMATMERYQALNSEKFTYTNGIMKREMLLSQIIILL